MISNMITGNYVSSGAIISGRDVTFRNAQGE